MDKKIIDISARIAKKENIVQRQSYTRTGKQLLRDTYDSTHPKRQKKAKKAQKRLNTIAGRVVRELQKKLPKEKLPSYAEELSLFQQVLAQEPNSINKVYSLHKPFTACIAKGKAHKKSVL